MVHTQSKMASLSGGRNWELNTGNCSYANLTFTSGFFSR